MPPHRAEGGMVIAEALAGIRSSRITTPDRKAPADAEFLLITGYEPAALRDPALLALGMALAARRSELVALEPAGSSRHRRRRARPPARVPAVAMSI